MFYSTLICMFVIILINLGNLNQLIRRRYLPQLFQGVPSNLATRSRYRIFGCIFYFVTYSLKSFNWDIHVIFLVFHNCRMIRTWERLPAKWTGERSSFTPNLYWFFIFCMQSFLIDSTRCLISCEERSCRHWETGLSAQFSSTYYFFH